MTGKFRHLSKPLINSLPAAVIFLAAAMVPGCGAGGADHDLPVLSRQADIRLTGSLPDTAAVEDSLAALCTLISRALDTAADTRDTAAALARAVFGEWGLRTYPGSGYPEHLVLTRILKDKQAACLGSVMLLTVCARRLGLPVEPVLLPGHIYLRFISPAGYVNFETLRSGRTRTDRFYRDWFRVPAGHPVYLQPVTDRELAGLFHYNLGNIYRARDLPEDALRHYHAGIRLFPAFAETYDNLAGVYRLTGQEGRAAGILRKKPLYDMPAAPDTLP